MMMMMIIISSCPLYIIYHTDTTTKNLKQCSSTKVYYDERVLSNANGESTYFSCLKHYTTTTHPFPSHNHHHHLLKFYTHTKIYIYTSIQRENTDIIIIVIIIIFLQIGTYPLFLKTFCLTNEVCKMLILQKEKKIVQNKKITCV